MSGPVVVGVDGSESSLAAVEVAAGEASMRGLGLRVVHAFVWPGLHAPLGSSPLGPVEGEMHRLVERTMAESVARARAVAPEVDVSHAVIGGEPLGVLAAESRAAALVVVGSRGLGTFNSLLLGSVAVHLAAHGHCPVMVVRGRPGPTGPVLLAVDGSPAGEGAVDFAFTEASLRGADLLALHAWGTWTERAYHGPGDSPAVLYDVDRLGDEEERLLAEALSGHLPRYPDVTVRRCLVQDRARPALIEASESAQLVVVGARGRGGFAGLLLGSVSQALLHHAHCPVAVVRSDLP
ncbi:universal stress protein [Streptomyces sp. 378]|uniref:universal stress protein n=1 Tax=Streptomyces sp. 378 TaxID=3049412 RepID=UPI0024C245A3|nr:universal stress protein [Streptomyces sp. 378]MDK1345149.1 universal stress protein [Streptomyces sp. 378]